MEGIIGVVRMNKLIKKVGTVTIREDVPLISDWVFKKTTLNTSVLISLEWARDKLDADIKRIRKSNKEAVDLANYLTESIKI